MGDKETQAAIDKWVDSVGGEPETGESLTRLGDNLGVPRNAGEGDDAYHARITKEMTTRRHYGQ